jgi:hypothetical protein
MRILPLEQTDLLMEQVGAEAQSVTVAPIIGTILVAEQALAAL